MLILQHCGKIVNRTREAQTTTQTWVGLQSQVDEKIATLNFGFFRDGYGTLSSWNKRQRGGALYEVEIEWQIGYDPDGFIDTGDELSEIERSTLNCAILSLPLEKAPSYRTHWNYYLIGLGTYATQVPTWYYTATDTFIQPGSNDFLRYRWIKQLSEMPTEIDALTSTYWQVVKYNNMAAKPSKLGVENWDYSTYTIQEIKLFNQRQAAGAAASKYLNKILDTPLNGDFGVTQPTCDWKVDEASVSYNGEKWQVSTTYTMSGPGGWDKNLYEKITEE